MAKIKLDLCVILRFWVLLCFVILIVSGTGTGSSDSDQSQNQSAEGDSELSLVLQRFAQIVGRRSHEQGKVIEKLKEQIQSLQSAQESRDAEVKSLKKELDQLKNQISEEHGVWILTPPVRGPPGKDGKDGAKGERGEIGPEGRPGTNGEPGQNGKVEKGEKGQPELKGDQGISAPQSKSITGCRVAMETLPSPRSKTHLIYPHGNRTSLEVLCDFETDGGGWTFVQKRSSGPKDEFQKNWIEYKNGFGSLQGNFWLGLDNIHALTKNGDQELRIELENFGGEKKWAKYSNFSISDSSDFYRLALSGFYANSTLKDSMIANWGYVTVNGMRFSTKEKDNDNYSGVSCAVTYGGGGGWWFNYCSPSSLNGLYFGTGETVSYALGIFWDSWKGASYSFAKTEMKIRTKKSE